MPIYEYYCPTCDLKFDQMRPMSQSDAPAPCPHCASESGRCASVFAARGSDGKAVTGSGGGCAGCSAGSCASCGGH